MVIAPLPDNGRLLYFADLRPDRAASGETGATDIAALVIHEYETKFRRFATDDDGKITLASGRRVRPSKLPKIDDAEFGEWETGCYYSVLELDPHGEVDDDWPFGDLKMALDHLDAYAGGSWEELPSRLAEAVAVIHARLGS